MHVLNHGSRCPTSGVASARYTRGSTDDGPGVSINRYGGLSSPTCCVIVFVLLYSLALKCPSCPRLLRALDTTAGTLILAQPPGARNRQIGWNPSPSTQL